MKKVRRRPRWAINWGKQDHGKDSDAAADAGDEPPGPGGTELAADGDESRHQHDGTCVQSGKTGKRK
jgi:hypothetical protein